MYMSGYGGTGKQMCSMYEGERNKQPFPYDNETVFADILFYIFDNSVT